MDTTQKTNDFVLLILNCEKYRYKALKQKETWLKDFDIMPYFHVIGEPDLETKYKFDYLEKILYVKTPDDYNSLPKKVINAYYAINKEYNIKYIFKTDDDQSLNNTKFLETMTGLVLKKEPKIHYAGHIVDVTTPHLSQYYRIHPELPTNLQILKTQYCSGRFYILSKPAIDSLLTKKSRIEKEYFEDYAIGYYLDDLFKTSTLNINTNKYFTEFAEFI